MAEGVLGLGSGQAASLNQELIDKLKAAENKARVEPIETSITNIGKETEKLSEITTKVNEFLDTIKPFDLYVSGGVNAFEAKSATATGSSVVFDAADETSLNTGTTNVTVTTLAKRDVFQSTAVDKTTTEADIDAGDFTVEIAGSDGLYSTTHTFDTTEKTYAELIDEINTISALSASLEQVGDDSYRLVVKSADSGTANALRMTGAASQTLGFTTDGSSGGYTEVAGTNTQDASNLVAKVNGIDYDVSSNVITVDGGLKITAVEAGDSSISIQKSTTNIATQLETMVTKYNELVDLVDAELYGADSVVEDKSSLRTMMSEIKDKLFNDYGASSDKNLFNFGFSVSETTGKLAIDSTVLNDAITNDLDSLKELFVGTASDEGLGTQLKTYVDALDGFEGLLTTYGENIDARLTSLNTEKESAVEDLDNKYAQMAQQFASYGVIINQMEASFSGLKMLIQQANNGS